MHGLTNDYKKNIELLKDIGPGDPLFDLIYDDRESAGCENPMDAADDVIKQLVCDCNLNSNPNVQLTSCFVRVVGF